MTKSLEERTAVIEYLKELGIMAVFHYIPLHSSPAGQRYGRVYGSMEVTEQVSDCLLRLPLYYEMREEDVQFVVEKISQFYER